MNVYSNHCTTQCFLSKRQSKYVITQIKPSIPHPNISIASNPLDGVDRVRMILKRPKITAENIVNRCLFALYKITKLTMKLPIVCIRKQVLVVNDSFQIPTMGCITSYHPDHSIHITFFDYLNTRQYLSNKWDRRKTRWSVRYVERRVVSTLYAQNTSECAMMV